MPAAEWEATERDDVGERVVAALERLPWVAGAEVRLREEGEVLDGELFLVLRDEPGGSAKGLAARFAEAQEAAGAVHWRIHDVVATAVARLQRDEGG